MTIEEKIKELRKLTPKVMEQKILGILKKHEATIVDLNIGQMMAGTRADSKPILPDYSPSTVLAKKLKGQISDHVTLRDEGDFQRSMFADTGKFPVTLDSQDYKTTKLVKKYGEEIFGLTKESKAELSQEMVEDIQALYKELL